jgi:ATP-dependent Lon protease
MLEVLDQERNAPVRDNYPSIPFDLPRIVFLAAANLLEMVSGPLLDRMQVFGLPGYAEEEKPRIAQHYLMRQQLHANGRTSEQAGVDGEALRLIINRYTRKAAVRSLEGEIGKTLRNVVVRIAEGSASAVRLTSKDIGAVLGQLRFESEVTMRTGIPTLQRVLARTPTGGDILLVQATQTPGTGALILIG